MKTIAIPIKMIDLSCFLYWPFTLAKVDWWDAQKRQQKLKKAYQVDLMFWFLNLLNWVGVMPMSEAIKRKGNFFKKSG